MKDKDTLFNTLSNINNWTMNCDTKASVILGSYGVAFSLIFVTDVINKIIDIIKACINAMSVTIGMYVFVLIASCICLLLGLGFLIAVLIPRIDSNKPSLMFFALVSEIKTPEAYKDAVFSCDEGIMLEDLSNQIYAAAKICTKKFKYQKLGLLFFAAGWLVFFVWLIIGYVAF